MGIIKVVALPTNGLRPHWIKNSRIQLGSLGGYFPFTASMYPVAVISTSANHIISI